jgi:hypothetical protein
MTNAANIQNNISLAETITADGFKTIRIALSISNTTANAPPHIIIARNTYTSRLII